MNRTHHVPRLALSHNYHSDYGFTSVEMNGGIDIFLHFFSFFIEYILAIEPLNFIVYFRSPTDFFLMTCTYNKFGTNMMVIFPGRSYTRQIRQSK